MYLDKRNFEGFVDEVFADEMLMDYSTMLGTEPETISSRNHAARWHSIIGHLTTSQHIVTYLKRGFGY